MIVEISVAIAVFIFAVLSIFIIKTLISVERSLQRINHFTIELEERIKALDSTLNSISNVGDITELESARLKEEYIKHAAKCPTHSTCSEDLADWLVSSIKLGSKLLTRR